jgi:hypothetical protein
MAGSMIGRDTPEYRAAKRLYRTGRYVCHLCGIRPGTWVDHQPPLADFDNPRAWHGRLLPACPQCQCRQGAEITNRRKQPPNQWTW